jgi:hypothetical protein
MSFMDESHGDDLAERPAGVILRDALGNYYAIPGRALARYLVPPGQRLRVESFLNGDAPMSLPGFTATRRSMSLHTTRRSDDLWLVLS